jgi:hypothetical protein
MGCTTTGECALRNRLDGGPYRQRNCVGGSGGLWDWHSAGRSENSICLPLLQDHRAGFHCQLKIWGEELLIGLNEFLCHIQVAIKKSFDFCPYGLSHIA